MSTARLGRHATPARCVRFAPHERAVLLSWSQIGPAVVERLEEAGYGSIVALREAGVDAVVAAVCRAVGSGAWANRRRALARGLAGAFGASAGDQAAPAHGRLTHVNEAGGGIVGPVEGA